MSDRELLEAAAKAAGYEVHWSRSDEALFLPAICVGGYTTGVEWNPLTKDADAFRLMVDCALEVAVAPGFTDVEGLGETAVIRTSEEHGTDKHAATRRAIVRAAAAMGGEQ